MEIPRRFNKNHAPKKTWKLCKLPECNREFFGGPIQKYCDLHKDPRNRVRLRQKPKSKSLLLNFKHPFSEATLIELKCSLAGCNNRYKVILYPKQTVYPAHCEDHRTPYRRAQFLRERGLFQEAREEMQLVAE